MSTNTITQSPFFKCKKEKCNFVWDNSITECSFCNARNKKINTDSKNFYDYLLSNIIFGCMWLAMSFIIAEDSFNFYSWLKLFSGIFAGQTTGKFILKPLIRKVYNYLRHQAK